ncbi:DNA-processing protein DprA [Membranihabitans marinus]|uniref:DNA-processing protein DprA n=1 Tax=Membranihabitans marinus TaxID=1227546 RepID=UPI001F014B00|nr:DNA-processing protein DprA [Membranihabitans marinus]
MENQVQQLIALTQIKGIGSVKAKAIIQTYGSVHDFFSLCRSQSSDIPVTLKQLCNYKNIEFGLRWAEKQMIYAQKNNCEIVTYFDSKYPYRLKHFDDSPLVLYTKGQMNLNADRMIGIVGTRKMTTYGKFNIEKFVQDLKGLNIVIISGLAYGVDTMAHRSALENGISTIAVMGTGLDLIYPNINRSIAQKMQKNGGLITELGIDTLPESYHFPARNRIIAALSDALLIVESKTRGGAMITANLGFGYHKDIFAFPGRSNDIYSSGPNKLIKEHKAQLIMGAQDLLKAMSWDKIQRNSLVQTSLFHEFTTLEKIILESYTKNQAFHIEEILADLPYSNGEIATALLQLELKGIVKTLPGSRYLIV